VTKAVRIARDIAVDIAKNAAMAVPAMRARRLGRPRATAAFAGGDAQLERFAFAPLRHLIRLGVPLAGRQVAEIGPGDYLTSGLAMLAAGAGSYTAIERFVGDYRGADAKAWYTSIERHWPRFFPHLPWPPGLSGPTFPESGGARVEVIDRPIEDIDPTKRFDVLCSFQVGEHVSDLDAFARMHARLMKPDGVAVHRVDFAPHDRWEAYDDPLTFLRPPDWIWSLMGSRRGLPNRFRHHEFVDAFRAAGLSVERAELETFAQTPDRSKLASRFREMPEDSLAVSAAIYVVRTRTAPSAPGIVPRTSST
jgi:SAM-dependent methyltransferase